LATAAGQQGKHQTWALGAAPVQVAPHFQSAVPSPDAGEVLLLGFELGAPKQRGVAKYPQILADGLRPKMVEQSAIEVSGATVSGWRLGCDGLDVGHVQRGPITIFRLFSEKKPMSTQEDDNQPVALAVVAAAVLLAVGLAVGFGIAKSKKAAPAVPAAVTAPVAEASAPAADASAPAADASAAPAAANASAPK
jgi:hypothetical protein